MLPANTNSSIRLALKGISNFASFGDTLRDNVRFLEEHGGSAGSHAHLLQDSYRNLYPHLGSQELEPENTRDASASPPEQGVEEIDLEALIAQAVNMSQDGHNDESVLAAARGYIRGSSGRPNGPGRVQRGAPVRRFGPPGPRVATPPRDPKDNKCANCNQVGHT